nr:MAG TPA: hypothetical protein [Caudoviricetes sp.]
MIFFYILIFQYWRYFMYTPILKFQIYLFACFRF